MRHFKDGQKCGPHYKSGTNCQIGIHKETINNGKFWEKTNALWHREFKRTAKKPFILGIS